MRKKKEVVPHTDDTVKIIGVKYDLPKGLQAFKDGFEDEARRVLKIHNGSRPKTIKTMTGRLEAVESVAIADVTAEHAERKQAIVEWKKKRTGEKDVLEKEIERIGKKHDDNETKINQIKEKTEGMIQTNHWWANKRMIYLMTAIFSGVDAYLLYLFTREMDINDFMKIGFAVMLGLAITIVPILISGAVQKLTSPLESLRRRSYIVLTVVLSLAFVLAFLAIVYLRFSYMDTVVGDSSKEGNSAFTTSYSQEKEVENESTEDVSKTTESHAKALSIFLSVIPLLTGVATFFISYESENIDKKVLLELTKGNDDLERKENECRKELSKYDDLDEMEKREVEAEETFYEEAKKEVHAECDDLREKINNLTWDN